MAQRTSLAQFLEDSDAWLLEVLAANLYFAINGDRDPRTESLTVFLARALGPGCRLAFFLTNLTTFVVFLWVRPPLVASSNISRGNLAGDFLAEGAFYLFVLYSSLGAIGRLLPRAADRPLLQPKQVPWIVIGDALPSDDACAVWFVFLVEILRLSVTVLGMHTIILGAYKFRFEHFSWLLVLQTIYVAVAAVETITRSGTPFGVPAGGARRVAVLRALVVVPFCVFFGVWTVVVSRVYKW